MLLILLVSYRWLDNGVWNPEGCLDLFGVCGPDGLLCGVLLPDLDATCEEVVFRITSIWTCLSCLYLSKLAVLCARLILVSLLSSKSIPITVKGLRFRASFSCCSLVTLIDSGKVDFVCNLYNSKYPSDSFLVKSVVAAHAPNTFPPLTGFSLYDSNGLELVGLFISTRSVSSW